MWFAGALKEWREFYLLIGTAGATLLALLFVAVSLGAGYISDRKAIGIRTFMSPVVIHFACIFFISALVLVPAHRDSFFATLIGAAAVIGAVVSAFTAVQVMRSNLSNYVLDYFAYGHFPALGYLGLLVAAVLVYLGNERALDVLAGSLLALTIVNIRNVWDLTLSMVRQQARRRRG